MSTTQPPEIFFVAGEPSGDLHTALLAAEIARRGDFRLSGAGGDRMRAAGVSTDFDSTSWGAIGLPESLSKAPILLRRKRQLAQLIRHRRPALLVLTDFGAFNVRLARDVRRFPFHQPIMYYFPPSSWDMSARDRSPLGRVTDVVATPFPWSEGLLRQDGINAYFTGHPVVDRIQPLTDRGAFRRTLGLPPAQHYVGLLPGSRKVERRMLAGPMLGAIRLLARQGKYHFLWSLPPTSALGDDRLPDDLLPHLTIMDNSVNIFHASDLVLTCFGTATLEGTAAATPMVGMYRGTAAMMLQYRLMRIPTDYYAMPNIMAKRELIPEHLQKTVTAQALAHRVEEMFGTPGLLAEIRRGLLEVRGQLGEPGAACRAADIALAALRKDEGTT